MEVPIMVSLRKQLCMCAIWRNQLEDQSLLILESKNLRLELGEVI